MTCTRMNNMYHTPYEEEIGVFADNAAIDYRIHENFFDESRLNSYNYRGFVQDLSSD